MSPGISKQIDTFKQAWMQIVAAATAIGALGAFVGGAFSAPAVALPASASMSELSARVDNLQGDAHTTHSEPAARKNSLAIGEIGKTLEGIRILWTRNEVYLGLLCEKAGIRVPEFPEMLRLE